MTELGLRERKKRETRQRIGEAAMRLFAERGFDAVPVSEVARAADVSEMTVFNYFASKEDLFFAGHEFFEEQLLAAIRERGDGESPLEAFARVVSAGTDVLATRGRADAVRDAAALLAGSRDLLAREAEVIARYTRDLADILAEQLSLPSGDPTCQTVAAALMGAQRAVADRVRRQAAAGAGGRALAADAKACAEEVFGVLRAGLADFGARTA